jgi:hypothetical protein
MKKSERPADDKSFSGKGYENIALLRHLSYDLLAKIANEPRSLTRQDRQFF